MLVTWMSRWVRNVNSTTFERLNLCQVNSITVINIVIYLYSTHIAVLTLLYILGTLKLLFYLNISSVIKMYRNINN